MREVQPIEAKRYLGRLPSAGGLDGHYVSDNLGARANLPARGKRYVLHDARSDGFAGFALSRIQREIQLRRQHCAQRNETLSEYSARE